MSDIHFGKIDEHIIPQLLLSISEISPDLVIISGDLTQRATVKEFIRAKAFLEELKKVGRKYFVIPGNHDIEPVFKPLSRIVRPYKNYKKYIADDIEPVYFDDEIAVASINTARARNVKNGGINVEQIKKIETWFALFPSSLTKILVMHHPIDLPIISQVRKLLPRAESVMKQFSEQSIDLYLSGHYHTSSAITTGERYILPEYSAVAVQAGTLSKRMRGEVPSFNVLKIEKQIIEVRSWQWNTIENTFASYGVSIFTCEIGKWRKKKM